MTYTEHETIIERLNEDGSISFIPKDLANSDYQRYLNPEAEQSTPSLENGTIS
jgi:hypothetical protein